MQTLSLRAQTIIELLEDVVADLVAELRRDYDDVDVKLTIVAHGSNQFQTRRL